MCRLNGHDPFHHWTRLARHGSLFHAHPCSPTDPSEFLPPGLGPCASFHQKTLRGVHKQPKDDRQNKRHQVEPQPINRNHQVAAKSGLDSSTTKH